MTSDQFKRRIGHLGFSQSGFARYVEVTSRTVRRWATGEQDIPGWVGVMLGLLKERQGRARNRPPPAPDTVVAPFPGREIGRNLEDTPT